MRHLLTCLALILGLSNALHAQEDKARIDSLMRELNVPKEDTVHILTLLEIARYHQNSNVDSLRKYANLMIAESEEAGFKKGLGSGHIMLGISYMYEGDNARALNEYETAYRYYEEIGSRKGMANCMNNMGLIYAALLQYDLALEKQLAAMDLYKADGNWRMHANSLNNVALIYINQMRFEEAFPYLQQSVKIMKDSGEVFALRNPYNNLSLVYKARNDFDSSLYYAKLAMDLYQQSMDYHNLASSYNNIALTYEMIHDSSNALLYHRKAIALRKEINDVPGEATSWLNLGIVYQEHHRPDIAQPYIRKAIHMADSMKFYEVLFHGYMQLALIDSANNKMDSAFYHYKIAWQYRDSMFNEETDQRLADMRVKYDTDQIKKENALKDEQLRKEKTIRWLIAGTAAVILLGLIIVAFALRAVRTKNKLLAAQKLEILEKNSALNERNKIISTQKQEITDSINYAYNIQQSLLPSPEEIKEALPDSFILFQPRDIISGDFYFVEKVNGGVIFAVADCTGHGVPGAMMSMLGTEELQKAIQLSTDPGKIIAEVNRSIRDALKQTDADGSLRDGMDMAVCFLRGNELLYAGAQRPLWMVRDGKLMDYVATKVSVGGRTSDHQVFAVNSITVQPGDMLYLTSDGYADQFGGPTGKKLMTKNLKALLARNAGESAARQREILAAEFAQWKGDIEQVDDVCVMGVRVTPT